MSSHNLPSQADSSNQQQIAQPLDASAPTPVPRQQLTVIVGVQSVLKSGQPAYDHSNSCAHFAELCSNTYSWMQISAADAQKLVAMRIPSQVVPHEVPSDHFPSDDVKSEQTNVFNTSKHHSQMVKTLTDFYRAQFGTATPGYH